MTAAESRLVGAARTLAARTARALERSWVATFARTATAHAGSALRNSLLYRWLTAEPEPAVVVIDLRETRTVGPFIALLDRAVAAVAPSYAESRLKRGVDAAARAATAIADTRPGRALAAALEPPEPPERQDEPGADDEDPD